MQSNQFHHALDLAREFRAAGLPVVIGGFHVSGCLSMLKEIPPEIQEALDIGCSLFAGEAEEGRLDRLFVTSAGDGRPDDPLAGALFEVSGHGVRGLAPHLFAG